MPASHTHSETQFIARQPIFDREVNLYGYELLYRDSEVNAFPMHLSDEQATGRMFFDALLLHGIDTLTNGERAFINLSTSALILELPELIGPKQAVVEIVERTEALHDVADSVAMMRERGYVFALDDYDGNPKWDAMLKAVNYIKLEVAPKLMTTVMEIKRLKATYPHSKIIIERIEDYDTFAKLKNAGADYFQGYFFARPEMMSFKNINPTRLVVFDLMRLAMAESLDFGKIQEKIGKDLSLTARILKLANAHCASNRVTISSLSQAVVYLGEEVIRRFITVLALSELGQEKPSELTKLGLARARFISFMLEKVKSPLVNQGYLVGLVSVLDAVLDTSLDDVLQQFKLSEECELALLREEGDIGDLLKLCQCIERDVQSDFAVFKGKSHIDLSEIPHAYLEAQTYADQTLSDLK